MATLIICSRNRPELLFESVCSILDGDSIPTELIIIDQSNTPSPRLAGLSAAPACDIHYVFSPKAGLSRGNNLGVARASHDLLAFTHDDVLVEPDWFRQLVNALVEAGPDCIVSGQVLPGSEMMQCGIVPLIRTGDTRREYRGRVWEDVLDPLNMAMYRKALDEVGPFDVRLGPGTPFPGAEDNDLGYRLLEAGYSILYVPEARLEHRAWRPDSEFLRLRWNYGVAQGAFYAKHLRLRDRYIARRYLREIGHRMKRLVSRREHWAAYGDVLYVFGMLYGSLRWGVRYRLLSRNSTASRS